MNSEGHQSMVGCMMDDFHSSCVSLSLLPSFRHSPAWETSATALHGSKPSPNPRYGSPGIVAIWVSDPHLFSWSSNGEINRLTDSFSRLRNNDACRTWISSLKGRAAASSLHAEWKQHHWTCVKIASNCCHYTVYRKPFGQKGNKNLTFKLIIQVLFWYSDPIHTVFISADSEAHYDLLINKHAYTYCRHQCILRLSLSRYSPFCKWLTASS